MPDEFDTSANISATGGSAVAEAPPVSSEPVASQDSSLATAAPSAPQTASGAEGAPLQASQPQSIKDYLASRGFHDVAGAENDIAAVDRLLDITGQAMQYAPYGQRYYQHREQIDRFLAGQQGGGAPQAFAPQVPADPLAEPAWNPSWMRYVVDDGNGGKTFAFGTPPEVVQGIEEHLNWQHQPLTRKELGAILSQRDQQLEQRIVPSFDARLANYQQRSSLEAFADQHASWICQQDSAGRPIPGTFSPAGHRFVSKVLELENKGVANPQDRLQLAAQLLANELTAHQQQLQPQAAPANRQVEQMRGAARRPKGAGHTVNGSGPDAPAQNRELNNSNIRQSLLESFAANGISPKDRWS